MTTLVRLTDEQMAEAKKLCVELPIIEDRLRRAGLYATAAAVNMAVVKIGYEVCGVMPPNANMTGLAPEKDD